MSPLRKALSQWDEDRDAKIDESELAIDAVKKWFVFYDLKPDGLLDREEWSALRDNLSATNAMLAIKAGGSGDRTATSVTWKYHRSIPQLPSPLVAYGKCYLVNDSGGLVTILDSKDGRVIERGRIEQAVDSFYASPVAGDGKVFLTSESGIVVVLDQDNGLVPLSVNDLGEPCYATPGIGDDCLYIRSESKLTCFAEGD